MSSNVVLDLKAAMGSLKDVSKESFFPAAGDVVVLSFNAGFATADRYGDDEITREAVIC